MINSTPAALTRNEGLKNGSPILAGTISQTLADPALDRFSDDDYEFLKFHGIYQGDDRDKRKTGKQYILMVRVRMPGGIVKPAAYLAVDALSDQYANQTLRITSRQAFQFHGVVKAGLGKLMKGLNEAMITTLAACGDVARNVMAAPTPATSAYVDEVQQHAATVSDALLPQTPAYHEIWVDGAQVTMTEKNANFADPLYGKTYLPRKFKVAFVIPPLNDIDVLTNDCGFIAIEENGKLAGYNLTAGGGMGMSHGNAQTFPRLADVICFVTPDQVVATVKAVVGIHRDFGDRTNRKHARLKYVIHERGVDWFRGELARRLGVTLAPARPFSFNRQGDLFGWHRQADGKYFLGLFIPSGRIKNDGACRMKDGLREVVKKFQPQLRLTPSQNLLLANIPASDKDALTALLAAHGVKVENQGSAVRLASMACVALPTCGLALAESERALPGIVERVDRLLTDAGLGGEELIVRVTGCPNGCARPHMAELALVGKAPGKYQLYVGGNVASTRLGRLFKESVKLDDLETELRPLLARYAGERKTGERFGDFCERAILPAPGAAAAAA